MEMRCGLGPVSDHLRWAEVRLCPASASYDADPVRRWDVTPLEESWLELLVFESTGVAGGTVPSAAIMRLSLFNTPVVGVVSSASPDALRFLLVAENSHRLLSRRHRTHGGGRGLSTPGRAERAG